LDDKDPVLKNMSIIALLVWIAILGFVVFLTYKYLPIPAGFKTLIYVVSIVIALLITLHAFGLFADLHASVPHLG